MAQRHNGTEEGRFLHYLLFPDANTLLPQVLEEDQFLALLPRGEIRPDARLFVSDTDSYLPALEVAVLLATARGMTLPPLPTLPRDRFATVVARMKNDHPDNTDSTDDSDEAEIEALDTTPNSGGWDAETKDIASLPLIGAPVRLPDQPAPTPAVAKPRLVPLTPPVGMKDSTPEDLHDPRKMLYDHVRNLATVPLNSFFGDIEDEIRACLTRYKKNVRLRLWGWLLFPVPFVGLYLLWQAWKEQKKIEDRLALVGVADYNWKETLHSDREALQLSRSLAPMAASMVALTVVGLLFVFLRTDFVDRALYFFATDSLKKSKGTTPGGATRPEWFNPSTQ